MLRSTGPANPSGSSGARSRAPGIALARTSRCFHRAWAEWGATPSPGARRPSLNASGLQAEARLSADAAQQSGHSPYKQGGFRLRSGRLWAIAGDAAAERVVCHLTSRLLFAHHSPRQAISGRERQGGVLLRAQFRGGRDSQSGWSVGSTRGVRSAKRRRRVGRSEQRVLTRGRRRRLFCPARNLR